MGQYGQEIELKLKQRTRKFALDVITTVQNSRRDFVADVLFRQLVRSATSAGANYRSACRARSKPDMASKLAIAQEELDESLYWLDLLVESGAVSSDSVKAIVEEGEEVLRILVSSIVTLRQVDTQSMKVSELRSKYGEHDLDFFVIEGEPNSKL